MLAKPDAHFACFDIFMRERGEGNDCLECVVLEGCIEYCCFLLARLGWLSKAHNQMIGLSSSAESNVSIQTVQPI